MKIIRQRIVIDVAPSGGSGGSGVARKPLDWDRVSLMAASQNLSMDSLCPGWRSVSSAPSLWTDDSIL